MLFCYKCGMMNEDGVRYCTSCGSSLFDENWNNFPEQSEEDFAPGAPVTPMMPEQPAAFVPPVENDDPGATTVLTPDMMMYGATPTNSYGQNYQAPQTGGPAQGFATPQRVKPQKAAKPQNMQPEIDEISSVGSWVLRLILLCIPIVNLILLIVWALNNEKKSRKNFAVVQLIIMLVVAILGMTIVAIAGKEFMTKLAFMSSNFPQGTSTVEIPEDYTTSSEWEYVGPADYDDTDSDGTEEESQGDTSGAGTPTTSPYLTMEDGQTYTLNLVKGAECEQISDSMVHMKIAEMDYFYSDSYVKVGDDVNKIIREMGASEDHIGSFSYGGAEAYYGAIGEQQSSNVNMVVYVNVGNPNYMLISISGNVKASSEDILKALGAQ